MTNFNLESWKICQIGASVRLECFKFVSSNFVEGGKRNTKDNKERNRKPGENEKREDLFLLTNVAE